MLLLLVCLPLLAALASWFIPQDVPRRVLLLLAAFLHFCLTASCWIRRPEPLWGDVLALDALGLLALSITSLLFLAASAYAVHYLAHEYKGKRRDFQHGLHFTNATEAVFTACLLLFLSSASLVAATQHLGLLWVGIEATTLVTAPAIYFHRHRRSLEATWKYLMICSVGIALALLGNILLNISVYNADSPIALTVPQLLKNASAVHPAWFKAAFIFILIGYGTKMGVAPMHTWLPDAHSEAPSLVSALLSGALLNGAFLGILRVQQICLAAELGEFSSKLFVAFGLVSLAVAAMFIVGQADFKRMLAYSSVEHMGILLLGVGIGGVASQGAMLHMLGHSLVKAALFMVSGNILAKYHSKAIQDIRGLGRILPGSSALWLAGFFAIVGSPPFSIFVSEFKILQGALADGRILLACLYLLLLGIVFVGMATAMLRMCQGEAPAGLIPQKAAGELNLLSPALLLLCAMALGLHVPDFLGNVLNEAAGLISLRN